MAASISQPSPSPSSFNITSAAPKFRRVLPREIWTWKRDFRCVEVTMEINSITTPKSLIVGKFSSGCSKEESTSFLSQKKHLLPVGALLTSKALDVATTSFIVDEKLGVLLLNLGGPETLDDVQPFLYNLFADPDIIRLPRLFRFLQKPLAQFISVARAPKSKKGYASIGGGSPLRQITDAQAEELRKALFAKNVPAKVYVGMRYWHPFTEEAIEETSDSRRNHTE